MIDYDPIPESTRETIDNWVAKGWLPGGFVTAVLQNDLQGAVGRADHHNIAALHSIVAYVYNECPSTCWGSAEKMQAWAKRFEKADEVRP